MGVQVPSPQHIERPPLTTWVRRPFCFMAFFTSRLSRRFVAGNTWHLSRVSDPLVRQRRDCYDKNMKANAVSFLLSLIALAGTQLSAADPAMTVYKTATCGCCAKWVEHMKANGFSVTVKEVPSTSEYRLKYGVPAKLQSCHTAVVEGLAIEGHVPAADVKRLLRSPGDAIGLAVPGMPLGSPGMEQGPQRQPYSVFRFQADGKVSEFQKYPGNQ